jgi:hypothetical protein
MQRQLTCVESRWQNGFSCWQCMLKLVRWWCVKILLKPQGSSSLLHACSSNTALLSSLNIAQAVYIAAASAMASQLCSTSSSTQGT